MPIRLSGADEELNTTIVIYLSIYWGGFFWGVFFWDEAFMQQQFHQRMEKQNGQASYLVSFFTYNLFGGLQYRAAIESYHFPQYKKRYSKTGFSFIINLLEVNTLGTFPGVWELTWGICRLFFKEKKPKSERQQKFRSPASSEIDFTTLQTSHHLYVIRIPPFCSVGFYNLLELSKVRAQNFAYSMNRSVLGLKLWSRADSPISPSWKLIHFVSNLDRDRNYLISQNPSYHLLAITEWKSLGRAAAPRFL